MTDDLPAPRLPAPRPASRPPARRYDDEEIARILKSAAELQEGSVLYGGPGQGGLTLEELRSIAAEAGIDPRFVDRAAVSLGAGSRESGSALVGGSWEWRTHREVMGEVPEEERGRVVNAIRGVLGAKGEIEDVYGRMEWSYDDGLGPLLVSMDSRDGATEIDVTVRRTGEVGLIHGLGIPMGGVGLGAVLVALLGVKGTMTVLPVILVAFALAWGGCWVVWKGLASRWADKVERLADDVTRAAMAVAVEPPGLEPGSPAEGGTG